MKEIGFRKKRMLFGAVLLGAAILLGKLLSHFTGPESEMWQRLVWIVVVLGTGLSGILCSFLGWFGILAGYGFTLLIGSINVLPEILPEPWDQYFVCLYALLLFAWPVFKKWKNAKGVKNQSEQQQKPMVIEKKSADQNGLLTFGMLSGYHYQLFHTPGEIRAYFLGGELKGINEQLLQKTDQPLRAVGKKDIVIPVDEIKTVQYKEFPDDNIYDCVFIVKARKKYRFMPVAEDDILNYMDFFARWLNISERTRKKPGSVDRKRLELFRKINFGYGCYILLVSLCWMFLDVPYRLFSVLAMIGLPSLLTLYTLFPEYLTILEKTRSTEKVSLAGTAFGSCLALVIRSLLDFDILNWGRMLILCAVVFVVCTVAMMLLTKEWKQKKMAFLYLAIMLLFYLPGTILQLNCAFDYHEPQMQRLEITDLSVSTSSKSPDSFYVNVVQYDGSELELRTYQEHFETLSVGDRVDVYIMEGTFGIPHAYLG